MAIVRAPLNSSPLSPRRRVSALVGLLAVTALLLAGCGDDGDEETTGGDDTASTETTVTTEAPSSEDGSTTSGPAGTDAPGSTDDEGGSDGGGGGETTASTPTGPNLAPGDACSLEEGVPDCIDPDGDGEGTYLVGGADCAATAPDISICEDLDGDGNAGYPDTEYGDLPTCSDEVPPPCNNPPGSDER